MIGRVLFDSKRMKQRRTDRVGAHRTAFDKNRKIILATQNTCGICGEEIDPRFKFPHPLSKTVDHIIPVAKGGHPSELANLQAAHLWCNRWKSDRLMEGIRKAEHDRELAEEQQAGCNLPQHYPWADYQAATDDK